MDKTEKSRLSISLFISIIVVFAMWIVFLAERLLLWDINKLGLKPREIAGLIGVIFSPFLHGSLNHIVSNTIMLFPLMLALLYFSKNNLILLFVLWFVPEMLLWLIGRDAYHIGSSIQIYSIASYMFFYGVLVRNRVFMAISLIIVFLNGSMIWGILPFGVEENVSWEGHLSGFVIGLVVALFFTQNFYVSDKETIILVNNKYNFENFDITCKFNFFYNFEQKYNDSKIIYKNTNNQFFYNFMDTNKWPKRNVRKINLFKRRSNSAL